MNPSDLNKLSNGDQGKDKGHITTQNDSRKETELVLIYPETRRKPRDEKSSKEEVERRRSRGRLRRRVDCVQEDIKEKGLRNKDAKDNDGRPCLEMATLYEVGTDRDRRRGRSKINFFFVNCDLLSPEPSIRS